MARYKTKLPYFPASRPTIYAITKTSGFPSRGTAARRLILITHMLIPVAEAYFYLFTPIHRRGTKTVDSATIKGAQDAESNICRTL